MLKGHVFKEQIFESQVFAYFIDTFLNKQCGIGNYGNNMEVLYSGNNVTIQDGLVCIRGRFIEEDTQTTLNVGNDNNYCKLVIEIDLDKENTEETLMQVSYKIIKNTNTYPELIQTDIVQNNSGIYQYELARFKTSANGITDFKDMRTYIDLNSIFTMMKNEFNIFLEELKTKIENVENGSAYILNTTQSKTITLIGQSEEGKEELGTLILHKQGKIATAYLKIYTASIGKIAFANSNLEGFAPDAAKTVKEPLIAYEDTSKGIQSVTPAGVGILNMYDIGELSIEIYATKRNVYFYKMFSYKTF